MYCLPNIISLKWVEGILTKRLCSLSKQAIAEEERDFGATEPALTFLQHVSEGVKCVRLCKACV